MSSPQLSVVMPVYNEAAGIARVVGEWTAELDRLQIDYELRLYDDGSRDESGRVLEAMAAANGRLIVQSHTNRGHGPTVMRGYAEARGEWVVQVDSDGEVPAAAFEALWAQRDGFDLLVGKRVGRRQSLGRWILTHGSRTIVAMTSRSAVHDVNSPFRLMRASWLRERVLPFVPSGTAVPNVAVSGIASRGGARVYETAVAHVPRQAGRSSINLRRALHLGWRGLVETLAIMRSFPR